MTREEKLCSLDGTESREDRERQWKRDMAALTPEQQDAVMRIKAQMEKPQQRNKYDRGTR